MEYYKHRIYSVFDNEGIKVKPIFKMGLTYDLDLNETNSSSNFCYLPFEEQKAKLKLSDDEFIDAVIDYIYDTTSVRIKSLKDLENYPSINNLPFILKVNEYNSHLNIFSLAFGKIPGSITIRKEHRVLDLGNIEIVDGSLGLSHTSINSLGKLKKVNGSFWISYHNEDANFSDLNQLEEIGGSLLLRGFPIKSLSKLKKVGGVLNLRGTKIEDLGALEFVGEHIYLPKSKCKYFNFENIEIGGEIKYFSS